MSLDPPPRPSRRESPAAPAGARELRIAGRLVQPQLNRIAGAEPHSSIQVEPKVMEVLLCLADAPGEVVSRETLLDRVWQGAYVSDDVVTRSIGQLRRIFGDDMERPRVIETIRKRGYRLLAVPETAPVGAGRRSGRSGRRAGLLAAAAAATALAAGALWLAGRPAGRGGFAAAASRAVRLLPVAGVPPNALRPAISPDGTRVAFTWNGGAGRDHRLFVTGLAGGPPVAITTHAAPAMDDDPRWSPDGTLIAFARQTGDRCQLLTVPATGGPERQLVPCSEYTGVSWSADGRWLAYAARPASDPGAAGPPPVRLRLLDLVSLRSRDLTSPPGGIEGDHAPALSPDGKRLAFVRTIADGVEDLFQTGFDTGATELSPPSLGDTDAAGAARVTFDDAGIAGFDWMPNGRDLVLSSDRGGIFSLWVVPASGGTPRLLAGSGAKTKHPSAARRVDVVVFESWLYDIGLWRTPLGPAGMAAQALVAAAAGTPGDRSARIDPPPPAASALGATALEWSFQPQFSPDGRRIVFGSTRSGTYELWVADADGGRPIQLTSMGGPHLGSPRWSPDGRRIAFTAWPEGRAGLYLVEAGGGVPVALTPAPAKDAAGEMAPSWSRDSGSLYFVSRRSGSWQVWQLQLATGRRVQVTFDGATSAAESADGHDLFFTRPDRPGIWRRSLASPGQPAVLLAPALAPGDWGSWTVIGDAIYYLDRSRDDLPAVQVLPPGERRPVPGASLPDLAWSGFAVSPDRRSLLYARAGRHDCTVVRLENP